VGFCFLSSDLHRISSSLPGGFTLPRFAPCSYVCVLFFMITAAPYFCAGHGTEWWSLPNWDLTRFSNKHSTSLHTGMQRGLGQSGAVPGKLGGTKGAARQETHKLTCFTKKQTVWEDGARKQERPADHHGKRADRASTPRRVQLTKLSNH